MSDLERATNVSPRAPTVRRLAEALELPALDAERLQAAVRGLRRTAQGPEVHRVPDGPASVSERLDSGRAALASRSWQLSSAAFEDVIGGLADPGADLVPVLCDALLGYGDATTMGMQRHQARPAYLRAAGLALDLADGRRLAHAAAGYAFMTKAGQPEPAADELWRRALQVTHDDAVATRSLLASARAVTAMLGGRTDPAQSHAVHSLRLGRRSGDRDALGVALAVACITGWGSPAADERLHQAQELARLAVEVVPTTGFEALELQGVPLLELGRFDEFRSIVAKFDGADGWASPSIEAQAMQWSATVAQFEGRLDEAERCAALAPELSGRPPNFMMGYAAQLYSLRRMAGRDHELVGAIESMIDRHPGEPAWRCCLAVTLARSGDAAGAAEILERARHEWWPLAPGWTTTSCLAFLAEAAALVGDAAMGERCEEALGPYEGLFVVPATGTSVEGSVHRFVGLAAAAQGAGDRAASQFRQAVEHEVDCGAPALADGTRQAAATAGVEL